MTSSIIIALLLIIILVSLGYILYLKTSKKYTRERFAFYGVSVIVTLITSFCAQIYSSQNFISAVINLSNAIFKTHIPIHQTNYEYYLLVLIIIFMLMQFILKLHKNWNGPISEIQFNKNILNQKSTIFEESYLQLKDFLSKKKDIVLHDQNDINKQYNVFSIVEDDKMPWYENVYELLTFSTKQYKIDLQNDYYEKENVFVSKYGTNNDPIAILCCIDEPDNTTIGNFVAFCNLQRNNPTKLIVAIQNGDCAAKFIKFQNNTLSYRYEKEMLNELVDFTSYKNFIKNQFKTKEITLGTGKTLSDIYVQLKGRTDDDVEIPEMEKYIFNWLDGNENNKHLSILGEYGCGKSVLSLKIAYELLESNNPYARIPILVELRGKSPRNLNMIEILSIWASNFRLDAASILKLHRAGRLLIIFEGFDEMDMIGDREMRLNHFQKLWEFAIPKSKIIITGRPNFFLDDKELKANLGIDKPYETSHYSEAIRLEKFTIEQIKNALRSMDKNTKKQIIEILDKSNNSNFYDLVSRPAILYLVSVIWKERKLSNLKDSINSAIVISEFIKYSYSRQSNKNVQFPLTEKEREYFMLGIAVNMLRVTDYSNQISSNELESSIIKLYKQFPDGLAPSQNAMQPKRKYLRERMIDNNNAEETILTDVRSCGILVNDLIRKDYFKFAHKSFLEYQVSLYFVESLLQDKDQYNIIVNAISSALDINPNNITHSQETISFTAEILISKLKLTNNENPKAICKKLFWILYPNKYLKNHPKIAAFLEMNFYSPDSASNFLFVVFLCYALLIIVELVSSRILHISINVNKSVHLTSSIGDTFVLFFTTILATLMISSTTMKLKRKNIKRASIWLKCCTQLNIPEKTISEIVSPKYIAFIRGEYSNSIVGMIKKRILKKQLAD